MPALAAARAISEQLPEPVAAAVIEFLTTSLIREPRRVGKPLRRELGRSGPRHAAPACSTGSARSHARSSSFASNIAARSTDHADPPVTARLQRRFVPSQASHPRWRQGACARRFSAMGDPVVRGLVRGYAPDAQLEDWMGHNRALFEHEPLFRLPVEVSVVTGAGRLPGPRGPICRGCVVFAESWPSMRRQLSIDRR